MKLISTFIFALIAFILTGWIGWLGLILIGLKFFGVINWSWWIASIPIEYGIIYCMYMTIDGAKYKAGLKDAGSYARFTQDISSQESFNLQIQTIISQGPEQIAKTIDNIANDKSRIIFYQSLLDASLEYYELLQIAMFANKEISL